MNIQQLEQDIAAAVRTPQALVSTLSALVAVLGTVGILNTNLTGALQAVLTAALGLLVAAGHTTASTALARRAAAKAAARPSHG